MSSISKELKKFLTRKLKTEVLGVEEATDRESGEKYNRIKVTLWTAKDGMTEIGTTFSEEALDELIEIYRKRSVRGILGVSEIEANKIVKRVDEREITAYMASLEDDEGESNNDDNKENENDQ